MCDLLMPTFCTSEPEVSMLNLEKQRIHCLSVVLIAAGASGPLCPLGPARSDVVCDNMVP